jgi:hypothetical protein
MPKARPCCSRWNSSRPGAFCDATNESGCVLSKTLRTAAIIVGAVALVATGVGAVASAAAAGATATGVASAAGGIAAAASTVASIATATAAAASLGAAVTARPPPLGGNATRFKADKDAGIPYVMGRTATGGNIIYRRTHNTAGYALPDLQSFAVVLSGAGPINAIESFQADRVTVSFSSGAAVGSYAGWMWQTQQLGASPESAALRVTPGGTLPPGWTTAAKMSGMAAAMWTLRYDQKDKFYAQGVPQPRWIVQGVKVYDPRLDSTYPGGSGACRAFNEATYVYSENPYLHGLTFAMGRYQNGKRVIGIGAPLAGIDVRAFVEGANVADANGWKVGGVITSADNKWTVLKTILQAGGGEPMHLGAMLSCKISTPRVTLATVTTDDLIGTARVPGTTSRRGRFNTVVAKYRSEAHDWEIIPAAPVAVASHITTDGGQRSREIPYSMVQDLTQAAELARYDIENAREFGPIVLPLKLRWIGYRPGDCIAVNLPEVGLNGQQIVIGNREIDAAGLSVTLTGRSETAAKHAFALGQTGVAPPTPSVSTPPTPPQPGAVAWSLAGTGLVAGATVTPALIITGAATNVPIDAVVIEYRLWVSGQAAGVGWIGAGSYLPDVTRIEVASVQSSTAYEIAVSYRLGAFTGDRRIIGPVTTPAGPTRNAEGQGLRDTSFDPSAWSWSTSAVIRRPGTYLTSWPSGNLLEINMAAVSGYHEITPLNAGGGSYLMPVVPGQMTYASVYAVPSAATQRLFLTIQFFKADGATQAGSLATTVLPFGAGAGALYTASAPAPSDAAFARWVVQREAGSATGFWYIGAPFLDTNQPGADVTPPWSGIVNDGGKPENNATRNVFRGIYSGGTAYLAGDEVATAANDKLYIAKLPSTGIALTNTTYWELKLVTGGGAAGANAVNVRLSNPLIMVATAADGSGGGYSGLTCQIEVYDGGVRKDTLGVCTFAVVGAPGYASVGATSGLITITDWGSTSAAPQFDATYAGVTYRVTLQLLRSLQGVAGPAVTMVGGGAFTYLDGVMTPGGQSRTLSITRQNATGTAVWTTDPGGITLTGSGDSRTLAAADMGSNKQVTIRATVGSVYDEDIVIRADATTAVAGATRNAEGQGLRDTTFDPAAWSWNGAAITRRAGTYLTGFPASAMLEINMAAVAIYHEITPLGAISGNHLMQVQPGQMTFAAVYAVPSSATQRLLLTLQFLKADGATQAGSLATTVLPFGAGAGALYTASAPAPSDAAFARWIVQREAGSATGFWYIGAPFLDTNQPGADVTAAQPIVSLLSPTSGRALNGFAAVDGTPFTRIVASGTARDGDLVGFPTVYPSAPSMFFLYGGASAAAGNNISIIFEGLTGSGFTFRAKSQAVSVGTTITDGGATPGGTGEPDFIINRSSGSAPFDGRFQYALTCTVGDVYPGEPGRLRVGIWARQGGGWQEVGTASFGASGTYIVDVTPGAIDFGAGAEFGISEISSTGSGTQIDSFDSVAYTPGTVSETSLTPAGASAIYWEARL